jgi:hypothetical protein
MPGRWRDGRDGDRTVVGTVSGRYSKNRWRFKLSGRWQDGRDGERTVTGRIKKLAGRSGRLGKFEQDGWKKKTSTGTVKSKKNPPLGRWKDGKGRSGRWKDGDRTVKNLIFYFFPLGRLPGRSGRCWDGDRTDRTDFFQNCHRDGHWDGHWDGTGTVIGR